MSASLLVFDLDGTLVDSKRDLADAANALIEELGGIPLPEERIAGMVGDGAAMLVRRALAAAGIDPGAPGAVSRFLDLYDERLLRHTVLYDGMADVLAGLGAERTLAVLTNKPAAASERILEGLGVRAFFRHVLGGDTPLGRKPDATGLLDLIRRTGAEPATTMLVGDSRVDLETARRAGARICLARYGFGYRFAESDFRGDETFIDTPRDLLRLGR